MDLSPKQKDVIDAPLDSLSVIACAGSGKTETAVRRVAKIRKDLDDDRSHVALLSFSNVAVDTFKSKYNQIEDFRSGYDYSSRVLIDTFDSFITNYILRPHAHRTMNCSVTPFLISGNEGFLENKEYWYWYPATTDKNLPIKGKNLKDISVRWNPKGYFDFVFSFKDKFYKVFYGKEVTEKFGVIGAYTHELGRYWALQVLREQPKLIKAIAKRFSHIIVDEAQDVGEMHSCILECLIEEGVKVSLIGDPNQAIYEFAGATGEFIKEYDKNSSTSSYKLDTNYRSVSSIMNFANAISGGDDECDREDGGHGGGSFYTIVKSGKNLDTINLFSKKIDKLDLDIDNSAVLFRGNSEIKKIKNKWSKIGQGKVELLANAAILRDSACDYRASFNLVCTVISALFKDIPKNAFSSNSSYTDSDDFRKLKKYIWMFVRSYESGLPSSELIASKEWHELLKDRLSALLEKIQRDYGYTIVDNLGNKLAKTKLPEKPLLEGEIRAEPNIRIDTVHKSKGESLDAVLYIAQKSHIESMLDGVGSELGRIGYVAVTRAKDLFVLGVPKSCEKELVPRLERLGLTEINW